MTVRLALFGASPDTPNMGVSALFASAVEGLTQQLEAVQWVLFDDGLGRRSSTFRRASGETLAITCFGARAGRRYYRPENLATMQLLADCGSLAAAMNEGIRLIDSCDAVLDVSGGDSFSDIYGRKRFNSVYWTKKIALARHKPLILLPQTYGPYRASDVRQLAESVTRRASMAWARDPDSFEAMKRLLGSAYDPAIHRLGVDMAFGLEPRLASSRIPQPLARWLGEAPRAVPLLGINVSGLIYNDPERARGSFRMLADYRAVVAAFVRRVLDETPARVVLVSHVMDSPGHYESDVEACASVAGLFSGRVADRLFVAPVGLDESEVKWLISQMDWFCGTRMHSTIASLSSGVPTAAIAYSDKTVGVFATCGQEAQVFDPRKLAGDAVVNGLWRSFVGRDALRESLLRRLPQVKSDVVQQMCDIASCIRRTCTPGRGKG